MLKPSCSAHVLSQRMLFYRALFNFSASQPSSKHFFSAQFLSYLPLNVEPQTPSTSSPHQLPAAQSPAKFLPLLHHSNSAQSLNNIHAFLITSGLIQRHRFLLTQTIRKYISFGFPEFAVSVHKSTSSPTLLLLNLTIKHLSDHRFYRDLLGLYTTSWSLCRFRSDDYTFPLVARACAALCRLRSGKEVHCVVLRSGYGGNLVVQTALVDMYGKMGQMEYAEKVFDKMSERDLVSWNVLVNGFLWNGRWWEAFAAFREMMAHGLKPSVSTLVSLVPVCGQVEGFGIGKALHGLAIKCGTSSDEALVPTLISMYADFNDLCAARLLFGLLISKDLVAWNALISAHAHNGQSTEAFEFFQLMHRSDTTPDLITLVSILPSCTNLPNTWCGESVHALGIKFGFVDDVSVIATLVSMYAKLGDLDAAQCLFNLVPEKCLILWNSMMSAYSLDAQWHKSLDTFCNMIASGVTPDAISMLSLISACSASQDLQSGQSAHAYILRNSFGSNINVMNALLAMYSDCDQFYASLKVFHKMTQRNVVSWNTLISGLVKNGDTKGSMVFFRQMGREGVKFDFITLISIIPGVEQVEDILGGMSFHDLAIKSGYASDTSLTNALISMYANFGDIASGRLLFHNLLIKSVVSWNALMTGCRCYNLFREVMDLFYHMKMHDQTPNSVTLLNLLPFCSSLLGGKSIHAFAIRNLFFKDCALLTSTMCMYARFEKLGYCHILFEMLDKRNIVAWNTMMSVYLQGKHTERTIVCFKEMLATGMEPDSVTILTLVSASSLLGNLSLAECVMGFIICMGFGKHMSVSNALIDLHARCGSISVAKELFDASKEKDSVTWGTIINALGIHGDGDTALDLFSKMQEAGVKPDDITFVSILSACSHSGLVDQARILFKSMVDEHRIEPRMEHYACMVDLLGRTGHLEEAYNLLQRLPFKPSASLSESLLGACQSHGNAEVGEAVGRLLVELKDCSSSSYVMLSNIYAGDEKWLDSGSMRCDMELRGLRKDPGVSLIAVM